MTGWIRFEPGTPAAPFDREQVVLYKRNATAYFQYDGLSSAYTILKDSNNRFVFSSVTESFGARVLSSTTVLEPNRFYHVARHVRRLDDAAVCRRTA